MRQNRMFARFAAGFSALLLTLTLLVSAGISVSAAESDGYLMRFTGSSAAGGDLHLSVRMTGIETFGALELRFNYDADQLTLTGHDNGAGISGTLAMTNDTTAGEVRFSAITVTDITPNDEIYSMDFRVNDSVADGDDVTVTLLVREVATNSKEYGASRGLVLTSTIAAGQNIPLDDPNGLAQQETTSRAPDSELPRKSNSFGGNSTTGSQNNASQAGDSAFAEETETSQSGGAPGIVEDNSNKDGVWLLPAAIALGVAGLAALVVILMRPKEQSKVEYPADPEPLMPNEAEKNEDDTPSEEDPS